MLTDPDAGSSETLQKNRIWIKLGFCSILQNFDGEVYLVLITK